VEEQRARRGEAFVYSTVQSITAGGGGWIAQIQDPRTTGGEVVELVAQTRMEQSDSQVRSIRAVTVTSKFQLLEIALGLNGRRAQCQSGAQLALGMAVGSPPIPCESLLLSARPRSCQSPVTIHHSPFTIHHSPVTSHQSPVTSRQCHPGKEHGDFRSITACSLQR
jgi:hypothetical protein